MYYGYYGFHNIIDNYDTGLIHSSLDRAMYDISETIQRDIFVDELEYRCSPEEYICIRIHMLTYSPSRTSVRSYHDMLSDVYDNVCANIQCMPTDQLFGMLDRVFHQGYKSDDMIMRFVSSMFNNLKLVQDYIDTNEHCISVRIYPEFASNGYDDYQIGTPEIEYDISPTRFIEFVEDTAL